MKANFHDAQFWRRFAEANWERKELCSDTVFKEPPLDEEQLFKDVLNCCGNKADGVFINFHIEGERHFYSQGDPLLPQASDGSFKGYHERMKRELVEKKYCLIINNIEIQSFEAWNWGRHFLNGLFEETGFNKIGVASNLFIGSDKTPFGIHQDISNDSVFHVPVVGRKGMRLWPANYHEGKADFDGAREYQAYVADSTLIQAGPGGILYWPSGLWHTSEKVDELSVSLAVALSCYHNTTMLVLDLIRGIAAQHQHLYKEKTLPFRPSDMRSGTTALPEELLEAMNYIKSAVSEEVMMMQWSRLATGFNFKSPTVALPVDTRSITPDMEINREDSFPILHVKLNNQSGISANGHYFARAFHPAWQAIVNLLNTSSSLKAQELYSITGDLPQHELDGLLAWLQSIRAIRVENSNYSSLAQDQLQTAL